MGISQLRRLSLLLVLLLAGSLARIDEALGQSRPDAPRYALPGPYPVGTRELTVQDDARPLTVTIWYPAESTGGQQETATYPLLITSVEGRAMRDAIPAAGPHPLVLFSHGALLSRVMSLWLTEHLASHGFVVLAADHPDNTIAQALNPAAWTPTMTDGYVDRVRDLERLIALAEGLTAEGGALAGVIDLERIAAVGHSFGGYTALALAGARLDFGHLNAWCDEYAGSDLEPYPDAPFFTVQPNSFDAIASACFIRGSEAALVERAGPPAALGQIWSPLADAATADRIDALIAFAPWNAPILGPAGLRTIAQPALIVTGSGDTVTNPERDAYQHHEWLGSADKTLMTLDSANHYVFLDACSEAFIQFGQFYVCSDAVWDMARAHDLVNHAATAFLLEHLQDDWQARDAFDALDFPGVTIEDAESS